MSQCGTFTVFALFLIGLISHMDLVQSRLLAVVPHSACDVLNSKGELLMGLLRRRGSDVPDQDQLPDQQPMQ